MEVLEDGCVTVFQYSLILFVI